MLGWWHELFTTAIRRPHLASGAQCAFLEVDPLHGMRGGHGAAVVITVGQVKGVSQFMDGLLPQSLAKQFFVRRETIELLPQAMSRNHSTKPAQLRLAKHEGQDWNIEV